MKNPSVVVLSICQAQPIINSVRVHMNVRQLLGFISVSLLLVLPGLLSAATSTRYCPAGYYAYRENVTQVKPSCLNAADFFQKKQNLQSF